MLRLARLLRYARLLKLLNFVSEPTIFMSSGIVSIDPEA